MEIPYSKQAIKQHKQIIKIKQWVPTFIVSDHIYRIWHTDKSQFLTNIKLVLSTMGSENDPHS